MMQARTGISDSTTEIKRLEQIKSKKGLTTQQEEQLVEAKKKRDESLSQQSRLLGSVEDSNILQLGSIMGVKQQRRSKLQLMLLRAIYKKIYQEDKTYPSNFKKV